jgi:WhiB family redox-sensing transcriptional regulator
MMTVPSFASWVAKASCSGHDPGLFFPDPGDTEAVCQAKRICSRCPVSDLCRAYGLAHPGELGIWGGLTEAERVHERRARPGGYKA